MLVSSAHVVQKIKTGISRQPGNHQWGFHSVTCVCKVQSIFGALYLTSFMIIFAFFTSPPPPRRAAQLLLTCSKNVWEIDKIRKAYYMHVVEVEPEGVCTKCTSAALWDTLSHAMIVQKGIESILYVSQTTIHISSLLLYTLLCLPTTFVAPQLVDRLRICTQRVSELKLAMNSFVKFMAETIFFLPFKFSSLLYLYHSTIHQQSTNTILLYCLSIVQNILLLFSLFLLLLL